MSRQFSILGTAVLLSVVISVGPLMAVEDEPKITFDEHIKPIFREHCTTCHHQGDKSSGLALDTYADTLAGGSGGKVVAAGNLGGSRLFALISHQAQPKMPPDEDPIAKEKQELIKTWIDQGMPENAGSKIVRASSAVTAMLSASATMQPEGPPPLPEKVLRQPVLETDRGAAVAAMAISPWAPLIAIGGQEQVVLYHTDSAELLGVIPFPEGEPQSLSFTRDGKHLLIGGGRHSHSGCAVLVDVVSGQRVSKVGDELDIVLAADISPNKRRIAIAGPQKIVRVFDSATGVKILELKKHTDWIYTLRYSPDGVLLASGDRGNGLVLWEAESGNLYADLVGHKAAVTNVDFRMDSNLLASASHDGTVKLWDMLESKEVKSWAAHGGGANDIRFARDGRLVTAGKDAKIKLWNGNGELQKEFSGLAESALKASVSGDGATVAGGDWTGKVQLWRSADPQQTHLVATNPPSIENRLQQSAIQVAAIEREFAAVSQVADQATQQSTAAAQILAASQESAKAMEIKLAEASRRELSLKKSLVETEQKMQALAQELAALRSQREGMSGELTTTSQTVQQTSVELKAAQQSLATGQSKLQQLSQAAEVAKQKQSEVQAKLAAAQAALNQARADKLALEQQASQLTALAQQSTAQAKVLAEQMSAAVAQEQADNASVEKMASEISALKEQLAALQQRINAIASAHQLANEKLATSKNQASELKSKVEAAEQSAVEAQEQLNLFQKVYSSSSSQPVSSNSTTSQPTTATAQSEAAQPETAQTGAAQTAAK